MTHNLFTVLNIMRYRQRVTFQKHISEKEVTFQYACKTHFVPLICCSMYTYKTPFQLHIPSCSINCYCKCNNFAQGYIDITQSFWCCFHLCVIVAVVIVAFAPCLKKCLIISCLSNEYVVLLIFTNSWIF